MGRLTRVELRKMVDTRSGLWTLATIGLITFAVTILQAVLGKSGDADFRSLIEVAWLPPGILLPIVGVLAATGEWSQRGALTTFALVPQRERVVYAKLNAVALLGLLWFGVSLLATAIGTAVGGGLWDLDMSHVTEGILLIELKTLGGFAFGLVFMTPTLGIVLTFVLPIAFDSIGAISKALDSVWDWLDPGRTLGPLTDADAHGDDWSKLIVSMVVWLVIPVLLGLYRTLRREAK
jgi:hypothetical protein